MKNRNEVKNFIVQIEQNFPVDTWTIKGVPIWPNLRIRLYYYLVRKIQNPDFDNNKNNTKTKRTSFNSIDLFIKWITKLKIRKIIKKVLGVFLGVWVHFWIKTLPKKKHLFLGGNSHRVDFEGNRYNRYFDCYIDREQIKDGAMYFEYDLISPPNLYNKEIIYKYHNALQKFLIGKSKPKINSNNINLKSYTEFLEFVKKEPFCEGVIETISKNNIIKWFTTFYMKILFFKKILSQIKPDNMYILAYYSDNLMALIYSANSLSINTIEMQHGPQTDEHLAYGSWSNVPKNGYMSLPKTFWCWDKNSANTINKWAFDHDYYTTKVVGNFWINLWKERAEDYKEKDFILYSLQTFLSIEKDLFPNSLIEYIKNNHYKWYIRLHPRQFDEKDEIIAYLKKNNIFHLVEMENASNDPLPLLLSNCILNITNYSGTAIEASLMNKFTVLTHTIGINAFKGLIDNNQAIYIDPNKDDFTKQLSKVIETNIE